MDGTEPYAWTEEGGGLAASPFLRLYRAMALDSRSLYFDVGIAYGVSIHFEAYLRLVFHGPPFRNAPVAGCEVPS